MITGERVVLRAVQRTDLERLWELLGGDLELQSLVSARPPLPRSRAHLEADFERDLRAERPPPKFAIEVDGTLVGRCELHSVDQYSRSCEVGIVLGREYWGRGFGQDATRALLRYAFRHLNLRRVTLQVLAHDERAVGAYRRAGFVEEGRLRRHAWHDGAYRDVLVMAVLRDGDEPAAHD